MVTGWSMDQFPVPTRRLERGRYLEDVSGRGRAAASDITEHCAFSALVSRRRGLVFQSDASADGKPHIWAVAATGGPPRQITKGSGEIEPDCHGSRLASSARSGDANEIVIHDLTTGAERKVTADKASARKPRWSFDGSRISFLSNKDGAWEIYTILLPEGLPVRITNHGGQKSAPSWSPDGNSLFYSVRVATCRTAERAGMSRNGTLRGTRSRPLTFILAKSAGTQRGSSRPT